MKAYTYLNLKDVDEQALHLYPARSAVQDSLHLVWDGNHRDTFGTSLPIVTVHR